MKDSDFVDLANRVIDGVGSEHDRTALEAVIRDSTQRRLEYEQLSAVASILDAVRPIEPPDDLRDKILSQIREASAAVSRQPQRPSVVASLKELMSRRPLAGFSYAVAAGLVVGVALVLTLPRGSVDQGRVFGTMAAISQGNGYSAVDRGDVDEGDILRARVVLETAEDVFRVKIDLTAQEVVDLKAVVSPAANSWQGVVREQGTGSFSASIERGALSLPGIHSGRFALIGQMDPDRAGQVNVAFAAADGRLRDITLDLASAGE